LSQASQDVCYSYVCLGRGSSVRLRGCRVWIAVSNTLHENEPVYADAAGLVSLHCSLGNG
jgi:hypothetical protein